MTRAADISTHAVSPALIAFAGIDLHLLRNESLFGV
jgi:hypothetical protein